MLTSIMGSPAIRTFERTDLEHLAPNAGGVMGVHCRSASPDTPVPESSFAALPLIVWLSPSFPVGSFAFSHGIEWAVHDGRVRDAATAIDWIGALLKHGSLRNDAIIASAAWQAVSEGNGVAVRDANNLALALAGSRERFMETTAQGNAFIAAIRASWTNDTAEQAAASVTPDVAYPVAVAIASAAHGFPRHATLEMFSLSLVQNLVSATIRLSVLGHTDGQRVIAALLAVARSLAGEAETSTLDDTGNAAFLSDIAAMKHETQYSRLFRS